MGGTVAVTIRRQNGEVIKMARKTGSYSYMFSSKELNSGKTDKAIDDYIKPFNEMREDYLAQTKKFPMSGVYGWCQETAPIDYGLVVIDFQNKKIHSMQGYDTPGLIYAMSFNNEDKKTQKDYDFLIKENKLKVYGRKELLGNIHEIMGSDITLEKINKMVEQSFNPVNIALDKLNLKKFKIQDITLLKYQPTILDEFETIKYEESIRGVIEMLKNLKSEGFEFNKEEKTIWIEKLNNYCDDLELDEDNEDWSDEEYDAKVAVLAQNYKNELNVLLEEKPKNKP